MTTPPQQPTPKPDPQPTSQPEPPRAPGHRSTGSTVGIIAAVVGGLVLIGALGSVAISTIAHAMRSGDSEDRTLVLDDITGIEGVRADIGAATFTVEFADTSSATLDITQSSGIRWNLDRTGDDIVVDSNSGWFWNFCLFGCNWAPEQVTLTLPESLRGTLDADLALGSGTIDATGDFVDLDLDISAGQLFMQGSAETLSLEVSAGFAQVTLDDAREASVEVSAGKAVAELTGRAPERLSVDVSAGEADLTIPDRTYRVQSDVAAGTFTNNLRTDPSARNTVDVSVAAGEVTIDVP